MWTYWKLLSRERGRVLLHEKKSTRMHLVKFLLRKVQEIQGWTGSWSCLPNCKPTRRAHWLPPAYKAVWWCFLVLFLFSCKWACEILPELDFVTKHSSLRSCFALTKAPPRKVNTLDDATEIIVATENASNPSLVRHRRMQWCLFFFF